MSVRILDCTLRDGGHLNKWKFSLQCARASYHAALKSGVDMFEVGYRFPSTTKDLGDFAYCTDEFLKTNFPYSEKCKLTLMIDAGKGNKNLVTEYKPENTSLRAIRVAAYPYQYDIAFELLEDYKNKKYDVFLNLMAASEINDDHFEQLKNWKNKEILNAIYFADSFGSFLPSDILIYYEKLKSLGFKKIGYHAHNNLQLAFANSLKAIEIGVNYIDASIYGMGRGGGNLPIEVIVGYYEKQTQNKYNTISYLDVIERFYLDLFKELKWGYNLNSYLCGIKNIHPYYVDELINRRNFTIEELWDIFDDIKLTCPVSFSNEKLNEMLEKRFYISIPKDKQQIIYNQIMDQYKIINPRNEEKPTLFKLQNRHYGRKFLIITNGPSILKYKLEIQGFVKKEDCITIGVNYLKNTFIPDYHIFVNRKRFLKYVDFVDKQSYLLIPSYFGKIIIDENYKGKYGFFEIQNVDDYKISPLDGNIQKMIDVNVGISAILLAYQMGASEIYIVGMDGYINDSNKELVYFYDETDKPEGRDLYSLRYDRFVRELDRISSFLQEKGVLFWIITPTSHKKHYRNFF